ncbi:MAG: helix-turn-helix transcriptional regulator [Pyramidobacter sp.]|nr:helix-turn-helix transcriptional regulator [Pyramidobacter sp.]
MREKLKEARIKSGMTQQQAAAAVGICERYYRSLELGARGGKAALWDKLEDLFRVPQRELRKNL